jgi:type II secretory pathway pseudopilin PulG
MTSFLRHLRPNSSKNSSRKDRGFTLTEVLISGGMFSMVMAGVAQIMTGSLAASDAMAKRQQIESAINNNIQHIHQANIQLSQSLTANNASLLAACSEPTQFLADELDNPSSSAYVAVPLVNGESSPQKIKRSILSDSSNGLTQVVYQFEGPEQNVETEQRVIDLFPRFISLCPLTQLSKATDETSTDITPIRRSSTSSTTSTTDEKKNTQDPRPTTDTSTTDPRSGDPKPGDSSTKDPQNGDTKSGDSSKADHQTTKKATSKSRWSYTRKAQGNKRRCTLRKRLKGKC